MLNSINLLKTFLKLKEMQTWSRIIFLPSTLYYFKTIYLQVIFLLILNLLCITELIIRKNCIILNFFYMCLYALHKSNNHPAGVGAAAIEQKFICTNTKHFIYFKN